MFDLSGKNALITGASGGIGGAIARNAKQNVQAKDNEKALAELKKYEIPGSEFAMKAAIIIFRFNSLNEVVG